MTAFSDFESYFWPGQSTLMNKLDIHNEIELEFAANEIAAARMDQLLLRGCPPVFDSKYLRYVHGTLFGDIYDWAGQYRMCEMSRNQDYAKPQDIPLAIDKFCKVFQADFFCRSFDNGSEMADVLAKAWGDLNSVHPFRDGNGRSQFVFFNKACEAKGYSLTPSKRDLGNLRTARDLASTGNCGPLSNILARSLWEVDPDKARSVSVSGFERSPSSDTSENEKKSRIRDVFRKLKAAFRDINNAGEEDRDAGDQNDEEHYT